MKWWCLGKIFLGILDLSKTFLGKLFFGRIFNYGIFPSRTFLREIFLRRIFLGRIFLRGILPGKWLYQNPCSSAHVGFLKNFVFVFVFVFVYVFVIVIESKGVVNIINFPQIYIWRFYGGRNNGDSWTDGIDLTVLIFIDYKGQQSSLLLSEPTSRGVLVKMLCGKYNCIFSAYYNISSKFLLAVWTALYFTSPGDFQSIHLIHPLIAYFAFLPLFFYRTR